MNYRSTKPCRSSKIKCSVHIFLISLSCLLLTTCSSKKSGDEAKIISPATNSAAYIISDDKSPTDKYYEQEHLKEWYPKRISPPAFNYNVDLSKKTIVELGLLRNEIFARNGYLFDDAVLRGYFNQFKWYQPIFDVPDFKVILNKQEHEFINKVIAHENELLKERNVTQGNYSMINMNHVYNIMQFKAIDKNLMTMLTEKNFAIVPAKHEQFFHVYDNNHYEYIPNFITTDVYLQVLHKHFSTLLQKIEEDKFIPLLTNLLKNVYDQSRQLEKETTADEKLNSANQWTTTYLAIAYNLISGKTVQVSSTMDHSYKEELSKISEASGVGSDFLKANFIQYSQFTPRGNYTKSKELENYFKCVKWLNTAPIYIEKDEGLMATLIMASIIKRSPEILSSFEQFNDAIKFIVGEEDNLSIANVVNSISAEDAKNISAFTNDERLTSLRADLKKLNANKIQGASGDAKTAKALNENIILFTAGRYTFDAEILSKMIHVLQPEPKRPFPKGLDVFAVLGNKEAENILLTEYKETQTWSNYPDSLQKLKTQFAAGVEWDKNIYSKTFETLNTLNNHDNDYPLFMKTSYWDRKNLVTSLAAWTELKHDMLLYTEQPGGAQAGEGGGPPPPQHISYVEPNVAFWKKALTMIELQESTLKKMNLLTEDVIGINTELKEIGNLLLNVSEKELAHEKITNEEFSKLSWIGGQIEYLTFRIFGSGFLPEKERLVALVADVYNYNGIYLEEAVGMVDEIYVVTEINGKPYLTKGAMFSYYEFTSNSPLTDEAWGKQVSEGKAPQRPIWIDNITVRTKSLESKAGYSF
jgi:hypothetical protein